MDQSGTRAYLSTDQLAERWGIARQSLANWRAARSGPSFVRIGRAIRYSIVEVERYEREHLVETAERVAS
ncbi:MAG: helix-turn-helix domain-containing protein [Planctomycetota bacterium]